MKSLALMTIGLLAAGGGLASAATGVDYSATIVQGGINLYTIKEGSPALVTGSPFSPTQPLPIVDDIPDTQPILITMDPAHTFLYAVYEEPQGYATIAGFSVSSKGLTWKWSLPTNIGGPGNHSGGAVSITAGPTEAMITFVPGVPPLTNAVIIANKYGNLIEVNGELTPTVIWNLDNVIMTPSGGGYYACFVSNMKGAGNSKIEIYSIAYQVPELMDTSTDINFYQSVCAPNNVD
jgi:hypothetical protein